MKVDLKIFVSATKIINKHRHLSQNCKKNWHNLKQKMEMHRLIRSIFLSNNFLFVWSMYHKWFLFGVCVKFWLCVVLCFRHYYFYYYKKNWWSHFPFITWIICFIDPFSYKFIQFFLIETHFTAPYITLFWYTSFVLNNK